MTTPPLRDITGLLLAWNAGDQAAREQLAVQVQAELHRLAEHYMARERAGHLFQATALINEAWLRLIDQSQVGWQNRAHFFGVAARLMRQTLVNEARQRHARKRGGGDLRVSLAEAAEIVPHRAADLVALDEALNALAEIDSRKSHVIELRFFGGLSVEETAEVLQVSTRTVKRDWTVAQAWLYKELKKETM
ncbi:MAG: sigma-70 family RNA polymerase sigma factor [Blastocatellia bacterium]